MNLLVVQDDQGTSKYLQNAFKEENIFADFVDNFVEGLEKYYLTNYDIIIIDTRIKNIEGRLFCEKIRKDNNKIGIICLSADKYFDTKINLFKFGIDDYVEKPFKFTELFYRIKALSRRVEFSEIVKATKLTFKDYSINLMSRELLKNGVSIELTAKEFLLIELLIRNKNIGLSRTYIREKVWGIDFVNNTNIVDVYIKKLRTKLEDNDGKILQSLRGYGYILKDN